MRSNAGGATGRCCGDRLRGPAAPAEGIANRSPVGRAAALSRESATNFVGCCEAPRIGIIAIAIGVDDGRAYGNNGLDAGRTGEYV